MSSKNKHYLANREAYHRRSIASTKASNALTIDDEVALVGREKWERMDLGLTLLRNRSIPGVSHCVEDIALWAGCSYQAIGNIEKRAIQKVKAHLRGNPRLLADLLSHIQTR